MGVFPGISAVATRVYLSLGRPGVPVMASLGPNVELVGGVARLEEAGAVLEGETAVRPVDVVVWCTGYNKTYPFLHPSCGLAVTEDGHVVDPLYRHVVNINHPTMAVIGINDGHSPLPTMDAQAHKK